MSTTGSAALTRILEEMNHEGGFPVSILTDRNGFSIASAADSNQDPQRQAAVAALVQKTAAQARNQLGMAQTDEISVFDARGQRLVFRIFAVSNGDLILAVLVPTKDQTYRRLTNKAIRAIQLSWTL